MTDKRAYFIVFDPAEPGRVQGGALDDHNTRVAEDVAQWVRQGRTVVYVITDQPVVIGEHLE